MPLKTEPSDLCRDVSSLNETASSAESRPRKFERWIESKTTTLSGRSSSRRVLATAWDLSLETGNWTAARRVEGEAVREKRLKERSREEGRRGLPERGISGRIRVPIWVLGEMWWRRERDGGEREMIRRLGLGLGFERRRKGEGRGGDGGEKLLRSSRKNLEGGGCSVRTSSIFEKLVCSGLFERKRNVVYSFFVFEENLHIRTP